MTEKKQAHDQSVFHTILARRSVRSYKPGTLDRATVSHLLEAAVHAPTAMHEEPCAFVIVHDRHILKMISDIAKPLFIERLHRSHQVEGKATRTFSDPDVDIFHGAGTLIVICAKPLSPFVEADCWLAAENLMLLACDMKLGTCVIGSSVEALNKPEIKAMVGIPEEYKAIAPIVVGKPNGETPTSTRKTPMILSWS